MDEAAYLVFETPGRTYHLSPGALSLLAGPAAALGNAIAFELGLASSRSPAAGAIADWMLDRPGDDPAAEALSSPMDSLAWEAVVALREWGTAA